MRRMKKGKTRNIYKFGAILERETENPNTAKKTPVKNKKQKKEGISSLRFLIDT
jgi:hypothetical protein